jgi:ribosomal-protein-alanine N-acetyltransferase
MLFLRTDNLLLLSFSIEIVEAARKGNYELEKLFSLQAGAGWPAPSYRTTFPLKEKRLRAHLDESTWDYLIVHMEDSLIIGESGFHGGPNEAGTVSISYSIIPSYRNRGYATEAAKALIAWVFAQEGVERVTAYCLKNNIPSQRVMQNIGMKLVGKKDDMLYWAKEKSALYQIAQFL